MSYPTVITPTVTVTVISKVDATSLANADFKDPSASPLHWRTVGRGCVGENRVKLEVETDGTGRCCQSNSATPPNLRGSVKELRAVAKWSPQVRCFSGRSTARENKRPKPEKNHKGTAQTHRAKMATVMDCVQCPPASSVHGQSCSPLKSHRATC